MQKLSETEMATAKKNCVLDFTIMAYKMVPTINAFMTKNGWGHEDDPRDNLYAILRKPKGVRKLHPGLVKKALDGMKSVCHLNYKEIHLDRKKYLRAWSKLAKKMNNNGAAKIISQYLRKTPRTKPPVLKGKSPFHEGLRRSVKLFTGLVMDLAPALDAFHQREDDPFQHLKSMKDEAKLQSNYLGSDGNMVVRLSFKARNATGHFHLDNVLDNSAIYIEAWIELCVRMKEGEAAFKLMKKQARWQF